MNPELKLFEKIRKVLIADTTIKGYVSDRVHTEHISTIDRPVYPAISLHLIDSKSYENAPDLIELSLQIDLWLPVSDYTSDDVMILYQKVRDLIHTQNLTDKSIGVIVGRIIESATGPMMYDNDSKCRHLPARYRCYAI